MSKNSTTVVTHSGGFHADDIFAVAALQLYLKQKGEENIEIIRTRDEEEIKTGDYVLDVGGVYDPENGQFDHHQEGGAGQRENGIPYAAFGLVWREYGADICGDIEAANRIDRKLVQALDGPDNGVSLTADIRFDGVYPYYLQSVVNIFKPTWREEDDQADDIFLELVDWAKHLLEREIQVAQDVIAGEKLVQKAYDEAEDKRVIYLDEDLPWRGILTERPEPLFVVYPKASGRWRLRAIPEENFQHRIELPEAWRGKRGSSLQEVTGVDSAVFCHSSLPMITTNTKEGIDKLVRMALDN